MNTNPDCCPEDLPVTSTNDPFARLMREHSSALLELRRLDEAAHALRQGFDAQTFVRLTTAINFINADVRRHNESEERYLFPLMEKHGAVPTSLFIDEHRELWGAYEALLLAVMHSRESPEAADELVRRAMDVVALLSDHIAKENDMLFPMAKEMLSEGELKALGAQLEQAA